MKWRALILLSAAFLMTAAFGQNDNTIHVKAFPGNDVGTLVKNAMATCGTNMAVPCILVIDPSLAPWNPGTMPTLCSHCYLEDLRNGPTTTVINVETLGCRGDGATDNFPCLSKIAANLNGNHYYFPPGTYLFNGCVNISAQASSWQLEGSQIGASILEQNESNTCGIELSAEASDYWEIKNLAFSYSVQQPAPTSDQNDAPSTFFLFAPTTQNSRGIAHFEIDHVECSNASRCFGVLKGSATATAWTGNGGLLTIAENNSYFPGEKINFSYPASDPLSSAGLGSGPYTIVSTNGTSFTIASTITGSGSTGATTALPNVVWNYYVHDVVANSNVTGATISWNKVAASYGNNRCWMDNVFSKQTAKEPVVSVNQCTEFYFGSNESDGGVDELFDFSSDQGVIDNLHIESYTQAASQTSPSQLAPIIQAPSSYLHVRNENIDATQCPSTLTYSDGTVITPPCYTAGGAQILEAFQNRGASGGLDIEGAFLSLYSGSLSTGVEYVAGLASQASLWEGIVNGATGFSALLAPGASANSQVWNQNGLNGTASGLSVGGNAATATALQAVPSQCSSGQFATGITASGNANCSTPSIAAPGSLDETGLTGNALFSAGTMYTLGASPSATYFEVCLSEIETTAASTSSTLPTPELEWISPETGSTITESIALAQSSATGNTTSTVMSGCTQIHAKASSSIQMGSGGYASSGATSMAYSLHGTVVPLR